MSRGDYLDQKNDKSTDGLAFIILSQFKSMYLFKKKQTKNTHYNCNYLNLKLLILFLDHNAYIPNQLQQTFDTPHYKNNMGIYEVPQ